MTYWSPTSVNLAITFHGGKAHAVVDPDKGISAVAGAAEAIDAMSLGGIDEETVGQHRTITGGEAGNVVPGTVVLHGMARSHDQVELDTQPTMTQEACEHAAQAWEPPSSSSPSVSTRPTRSTRAQRPYRETAAAIVAVGLDVVARKSGSGTSGNFSNAKGIRCVALPTGMVDEHASNEHIAIGNIVTACQVLIASATQAASTAVDR